MANNFLASNLKNLKDIISNYQAVGSNCERMGQMAKEAYLSATDYHKYYSPPNVVDSTIRG